MSLLVQSGPTLAARSIDNKPPASAIVRVGLKRKWGMIPVWIMPHNEV